MQSTNNTTTNQSTNKPVNALTGASLIDTNTRTLREGIELLELLDTKQYQQGFKPAFHSTIGAHFRHILEHYRCFFKHKKSNCICYDDRERDQLLEVDQSYALDTLDSLLVKFDNFDHSLFESGYQMSDQQVPELVPTTVARELLFLQSHTVHHYAIVGAMVRMLGKQPKDDFGVAIATRNFLIQQAQAENSAQQLGEVHLGSVEELDDESDKQSGKQEISACAQ